MPCLRVQVAGVSGDLASRLRAGALGRYREEIRRSGAAAGSAVNASAQAATADAEIGTMTASSWYQKHGAGKQYNHRRWGRCLTLFVVDGQTHQCERPGHHRPDWHRCRCQATSETGQGGRRRAEYESTVR